MKIHQLEPQAIWKNFELLNAVPRPSKKEERVIEFVQNFGQKLGLETSVDEVGNILIKKPATPGMEDRETVVLQSHVDMVCQKNNDTEFDFETQGIQMYVDGDWVKAKGTTLGADNGLGVATMMALLESTDIPHPALEALFTTDEETGMTGAKGLKPGLLTGKIMLNLDTEEDDEITIGCAGGVDVTGSKMLETSVESLPSYELVIKGLQGGHSGGDIHKGFGNANKLLGRFLLLGTDYGLRIGNLDGGGLRNAIPREAKAVFSVSQEFEGAFQSLKEEILKEFQSVEKDLNIELRKIDETSAQYLSEKDSATVAKVISALHNGVYRMSPSIAGLVEASNNVARLELKEGIFKVQCLTRSSVESSKYETANQLKSVMELAGMEVTYAGSYPGWSPNPSAPILQVMTERYQALFEDAPKVEACHAGLECGIIGSHYPEMEMVSFGPCIRGAHSPDERASISSSQKFWKYLLEILAHTPKK